MNNPTPEELAALDDQFTVEDWAEDMEWLDQHGFEIVRKEE